MSCPAGSSCRPHGQATGAVSGPIGARLLQSQQRLLAFQSPGIAGHLPLSPDDAMAGHDDAPRIAGDGGPDGAAGLRLAQAIGNLAVALAPAEGDGLQPPPDRLLKRRSEWGEFQVEVASLTGQVFT